MVQHIYNYRSRMESIARLLVVFLHSSISSASLTHSFWRLKEKEIVRSSSTGCELDFFLSNFSWTAWLYLIKTLFFLGIFLLLKMSSEKSWEILEILRSHFIVLLPTEKVYAFIKIYWNSFRYSKKYFQILSQVLRHGKLHCIGFPF